MRLTPMRLATVLAVGMQFALVPALLAQSQPAAPAKPATAASKPATAPAKPAASSAASSVAAKPTAQPAAQPAQATSAKTQSSPAKPTTSAQTAKPAAPSAKPAAQKPAAAAKQAPKTPKPESRPKKPVEAPAQTNAETETKVARRDPFESLVARQEAQKRSDAALPPGIHGLQVSTLRLDGVVKSHNGMIAVVSNPQSRTYFLREGDQLYDGTVDKIAMDGVSFHEIGKDAFGKPVERQVNKRIYSSAGEQQ